MSQVSENLHEPECPLAHHLINKLSTVIGNCDLLMDKTPEDSPALKQVLQIREVARSMAADLAKFQCDLVNARINKRTKNTVA